MKKAIERLEELLKIEQTLLNNAYDLIEMKGYQISVMDRIFIYRSNIDNLKQKIIQLQQYKQCNCSRLRKFITKIQGSLEMYDNGIEIYYCRKCNGKFSKV